MKIPYSTRRFNEEYNPIFTFIEFDSNKQLKKISKEVLSKAYELKKQSKEELCAITFNAPSMDAISHYGIDTLINIQISTFCHFPLEDFAEIISSLIQKYSPKIFLFGADSHGQALASRLSGTLHYGLISNCIEVSFKENTFFHTRPTYGETLLATIINNSSTKLATIQPGATTVQNQKKNKPEMITPSVEYAPTLSPLRKILEQANNEKNIENARIVIAGGRGIGSAKGFELLNKLANVLGGEIAGSRAAVDAGWIPSSKQIGQSGKIITPSIYIAVGISGAIQHVTGMKNSKCIIAINKSSHAPILSIADYAVIGDYNIIVPHFIDAVKKFKH